VEVEAYIGEDDRASHARFGRTDRNAVMYGPPGMAYVYLVYGMHDCLNVVTEPTGRPAAVLVRALEPLEGLSAMRAGRADHVRRSRRSANLTARDRERLAAVPDDRLASGPGLVAAAMGIDRRATGTDLLDPGSDLRIEAGSRAGRSVAATPRLGIGYAGEPWVSRPWRLILADSPSLSGPSRGRGGRD
jgi:DNA-3-methyladenine glycosylase